MRIRQIKNFLLTLLLSQGTPMLLAGDEFRHTQKGNNNAYCQDNELSWLDWSLKDKNSEIFRFTRKAIAFRLHHPAFRRPEFFMGQNLSYNSLLDITWFDETATVPDWTKQNRFLACRMDGSRAEIFNEIDDNDFYLMFNPSSIDITVKLPVASPEKKWYRAIDTSVPIPGDFLSAGEEEIVHPESVYILPAHSMAVLLSK